MRTTLDIDNTLLKRRKQLASTARTALLPVEPPIIAGRGGLQSGIGKLKKHRVLLDPITDTNLTR